MSHAAPCRLLRLLLLFVWSLASAVAQAALTDIANAPLKTAGAKPNVMLILDDSGSMQWSFLDDRVKTKGYQNTVGYRSALCNRLYYNPDTVYAPPAGADGAALPDAPFDAAWLDGYQRDATSLKVDLGTSFRAWRSSLSDPEQRPWDCWDATSSCEATGAGIIPNAPEAAYYFVYRGSRLSSLGDNSASDDCRNTAFDTASGGSANWLKVTVSATSGPGGSDERRNFANWYSYYRTRILAMKTALTRAVRDLDSNYRIGYSTIGYAGTESGNNAFLPIGDFNAAQKNALYAKLAVLVQPASGTPLRGALSKAGRLYGAKIAGAGDPVQYACQQNFAILSTDGYWNSNVGLGVDEGTTYGPLDLSGAPVGNRDGTLPRPLHDGTPAANAAGVAGGASDTLADVAAYYYDTDLRTPALNNCRGALGLDVCANQVPATSADPATHQHMTTFTLGLGVSGTLAYRSDYPTAASGDFADIVGGVKNWPPPNDFGPSRIDDLWHAAVNGRGLYFSAADPAMLASTLSGTLAALRARLGSAAAAASSNLEPVPGDNLVFAASYRNVQWDGELEARTVDPASGAVSQQVLWSAQAQLRRQAQDGSRVIHTDAPASPGTRLKPFTWQNLSDTEKAHFNSLCAPAARLTQCGDFNAAQLALATGERLVNYLRGDSSAAGGSGALFRPRDRVLGDIVNAQPLYVGAPAFNYADAGHAAFRAAGASRAARVYVGANDGMLHAFHVSGADAGKEAWAYVPAPMLPRLYLLADRNYAAMHRPYVDASPVAGDICPNAPAACAAGDWRTILVGGYGAGGRGYYALDITDPDAPRALWQYTAADDSDLGLGFGNPVIAKNPDGAWVVIFASGYNNAVPGDGKGYLYVLNAASGSLIRKIGTGEGSAGAPSGLARINAWVESPLDNAARHVYGGDLLGNLWRFDIGAGSVLKLAELGNVGNVGTQPVTTRPELAVVRSRGQRYAVVAVGTGRYLGLSDIADVSQQSIYVVKDELGNTGLGKVRTEGVLRPRTLTASVNGNTRSIAGDTLDWGRDKGWYVDLNPGNASAGERVNVDMDLQLGMLKAVGNVPSNDACGQGGSAWLYAMDLGSGLALPRADSVSSLFTATALLTGIRTLRLTSGVSGTLASDSAGIVSGRPDDGGPASSRQARRKGWRELGD
ncbi:pilus assembly protein [Noviherbaspirillum soli]|uniref:pilus assembly protein n=1 Tax=Noviherbaspirillum soli TaxID=1064518 RepID=UPI00188A0C83|nr:PilC/PilY family type IV pilus protein [Noviherbaspirillum soli]